MSGRDKCKAIKKGELDPDTVFHAQQPYAYMTGSLMEQWISKVLVPWISKIRAHYSIDDHVPALLLLDHFNGHMTFDVIQLLRSENIRMVLVPAGLTDLVQPLDVSFNYPFKAIISKLRQQGCSAQNTYTINPSRDADSQLLRIEHIALLEVKPESITNGFIRSLTKASDELVPM